jgi:hypothetical protein
LHQTAYNQTQKESHPEVMAAARFIKAFGLIPENQYVDININSPLIDFIRPAHLPQLNEQGHQVNTNKV